MVSALLRAARRGLGARVGLRLIGKVMRAAWQADHRVTLGSRLGDAQDDALIVGPHRRIGPDQIGGDIADKIRAEVERLGDSLDGVSRCCCQLNDAQPFGAALAPCDGVADQAPA